jgi:hypothetical protein
VVRRLVHGLGVSDQNARIEVILASSSNVMCEIGEILVQLSPTSTSARIAA